MNASQAKKAIVDIGKRMYDRNLVAGNDGNVSIRLDDGKIACTPTLVSKGFMEESQICIIDIEGTQLEGSLKVTSEIKMHLGIYKENNEIMSIVHAHPIMATSFAAAGIPLTEIILAEAVSEPGPAPLASFAEPGTEEVAKSVRPLCNSYNACLLEKHGALTWGKDIYEAYFRMEKLEHNAQIYVTSKCLTLFGKLNGK